MTKVTLSFPGWSASELHARLKGAVAALHLLGLIALYGDEAVTFQGPKAVVLPIVEQYHRRKPA
jgi:hypothetical protein